MDHEPTPPAPLRALAPVLVTAAVAAAGAVAAHPAGLLGWAVLGVVAIVVALLRPGRAAAGPDAIDRAWARVEPVWSTRVAAPGRGR